tara:strand:+ start:121 stop:660 length:540 start_codon:yes stop_codon:yes gene_type:complete
MKYKKSNSKGMTTPELVLAIFMLTAFTGITVMVSGYISRFFQPLNVDADKERIQPGKEFKDKLNDLVRINKTIDSIIDLLSEPGINRNDILKLNCTQRPSSEWNIPSINDETAIPDSYTICIRQTSIEESDYLKFASGEGKPGIYIIYSKPVFGVSINAIPVRRIFCRPKPFCIDQDIL